MVKLKNIWIFILVGFLFILTSCQSNNNETPTNVLESIKVSEKSQTTFKIDNFDLSKIIIECIYTNETTEVVVTESMITNDLDSINTTGKHTLDISYEEKTCNVEIEIISILSVSRRDTTKEYIFRQNELDLFELDLYAIYSDGSEENIYLTMDMISNPEVLDIIGEQFIECTYEGYEFFIPVEIIEGIDYDNFLFEALPYNEGYAITGYVGNRTNLIIPDYYNDLPVKEIGIQAFFKQNTIERVVIPSTVTTIGEAAFYQSTSIKSIIVPSSVTQIDQYALKGIKKIYLESDVIPSNFNSSWYDSQESYLVLGIDVDKLYFNGQYEYYEENGKIVLSNYFGNDSDINLYEITLDEYHSFHDIDRIGGACFKDNIYIESLIIPSNIVKLEPYSLAGLTSLTSVTLRDGLEEIGDYAFRGCTIIENITLPSTLKKIGHSSFNMCSALQELILPYGLEYIGDYAFSWCVNLTKIYIPNTVEVIKGGACYSCSKATIYTAYLSEPATWESGWNMSNRKVVYGYSE